MKKYIPIILITVIGAIIRVINISPFKIYPDAYQSLLVAKNIRDYQNIVAPMGKDGLLFPTAFAWSRPGYPLLIDLFQNIFGDVTKTALYLSVLLGIVSVPLTYLLIKNIYKSESIGLFAALLLALSFDHIVWGGFILTETTGVFFVLILLLSLSYLNKDSTIFDYKDLATGLILGFSVLVRYEYAILLVPIIYYFYKNFDKPLLRITNITIGLLVVLIPIFSFLFPINSTFSALGSQIGRFVKLSIAFGFLLVTAILYDRHAATNFKNKVSKATVLIFVICSCIYFLITIISHLFDLNVFNLKHFTLGTGYFIYYDILLFVSFIGGLLLTIWAINTNKMLSLAFFSILSLMPFYFFINPEMMRYWTHVIPFLIIPASYALNYVYLKYRKVFLYLFFPLLLFQFYLSFNGVKNWKSGEWNNTSYEERAAIILREKVIFNDNFLIVSQPESYYYFLNQPVQSVIDTPPYFFLDDISDSKTAYIIIDMGMYKYFPAFSSMVEAKMADNIISTFWVHRVFHVGSTSYAESLPVTVYKTDLQNLKSVFSMLD